MKKCGLAIVFFLIATSAILAQDKEEGEMKKGFKKENLFTGGSLSLGFGTNSFLVGANPVFGYSVASWLDAGVVANYTYSSYRDVSGFDDKLRQSIYGGGAFTRIYPIRFLFAQAQYEHNWIKQKYIPSSGVESDQITVQSNSLLVGGGYSTTRQPNGGGVYFYFAVLFDITKELYSPYLDNRGRSIPIFRGGIHVPLFQPR